MIVETVIISLSPVRYSTPVFTRNYHHTQPTVMYVVIVSDLREVSIADFQESYYQPTDKILSNIPPPYSERNYYQAKPTVLSVGIFSDIKKVSIVDC